MGILSKSALMYNCALLRDEGQLYMWTFTLPIAMHPVDGAQMWGGLCKDLRRHLGFRGVRVFELHPGGHGLHVHCLTPDFIDVNAVRYYAELHGWGRIDVVEWHDKKITSGDYLAKYLTKQVKHWRGYCLKGVRWWSTFGMADSVRVRDCSIESPRRKLWDSIPAWFVCNVMGIEGGFSAPEKKSLTAHEKRVLEAAKESFRYFHCKGTAHKKANVDLKRTSARMFNFAKMWICNRIYFNYETFLDCFNGDRGGDFDRGVSPDLRRLTLGFDVCMVRALAFRPACPVVCHAVGVPF